MEYKIGLDAPMLPTARKWNITFETFFDEFVYYDGNQFPIYTTFTFLVL